MFDLNDIDKTCWSCRHMDTQSELHELFYCPKLKAYFDKEMQDEACDNWEEEEF